MTTEIPVALVTAGSAGVGAATAKHFARNGMRVVVNYANNAERAENLIKELSCMSTVPAGEGSRTDFCAVKADLGSRDEIIRLVEETVAAMGRLDVVFSNGGWTHIRNIRDLDDNLLEDEWDMCFKYNVKSHLWLMHASRKYLEEAQGAFVTMASMAGVISSGSSMVSGLPDPRHFSEGG